MWNDICWEVFISLRYLDEADGKQARIIVSAVKCPFGCRKNFEALFCYTANLCVMYGKTTVKRHHFFIYPYGDMFRIVVEPQWGLSVNTKQKIFAVNYKIFCFVYMNAWWWLNGGPKHVAIRIKKVLRVTGILSCKACLKNCEKLLLALSCPPVRPSAWNYSAPTGRSLIKLDIWAFFRNYIGENQISLKSDKNNAYSTWRSFHIYDDISLSSS